MWNNWYDSYDILIGIQTYFDERVAEFEKNKKNKKDRIRKFIAQKNQVILLFARLGAQQYSKNN